MCYLRCAFQSKSGILKSMGLVIKLNLKLLIIARSEIRIKKTSYSSKVIIIVLQFICIRLLHLKKSL
jgi:hypothetical protein